MKRTFTFKEAKKYTDTIKYLFRELEKIINYPERKSKEVNIFFESLYKSNYFSSVTKKELVDKEVVVDDEFKKLVLLIYQYLCSDILKKQAKQSKQRIDSDISNELSCISIAINPVKWFVASKKKKQEALKAFDNIKQYINSSIINDTNKIFEEMRDIESVSIDKSYNEFVNNKKIYETTIKNINVKYNLIHDYRPTLDVFKCAISKQQDIDNNLVILKENCYIMLKKIKDNVDVLLDNELAKILSSIPLEELNRTKRGIKTKALKAAGYTNLLDIHRASIFKLTSVYGIGKEAAMTIKRVTDNYVYEARRGLKIKLSFDNKTKASTEVVKNICIYREKNKVVDDIKHNVSINEDFIKKAFTIFEEVGSGQYWMFYSNEYKQHIKDTLDEFNSLFDGEYGKTIINILDRYTTINDFVTLEYAWNDFKNNSIEFYNIINEVCPGVLDNNDSYYGLPVELADEVSKESYALDGLLCKLRKYQEWGVKFILHQGNVLLGDEMGLGKTIQAIATMVCLKNAGATHFVVVCPAGVVTNWCREITKHSTLDVHKAHGTDRKFTFKKWIENGGVIVTSYESICAFDYDQLSSFSLLVVDEAHYIKNKNAMRTIRTINLCRYADRLLFMTGTALENRVDEMISLISILRPDIENKLNNIAYMPSAPIFREKIAPFYYRRKREDVLGELPEKIENNEWCTLSKEEEHVYEQAIISKKYNDARKVSWNIENLKNSSKMNRLKEIIEEAKNDGRKILVYSFYLDVINNIIKELGPNICLNPINGSISSNRRQEIIDEFNDAPAGTVLCAQIQSGGVGLNIQAASVVVICEPQLKPSIENQAISRAYRMGQSRNVQVFRLLCENTIDDKITDLLKEKQKTFDVFADKSVAAEDVEIDNTKFGDIILEEFNRIISKINVSKDKKIITPISKWEKARDTYKGAPVSVTKRIGQVVQPYGGYINPRDMDVMNLPIDNQLATNENIHPSLIGIAIDYLTRYMLEKDVRKAFDISIRGAKILEKTKICDDLLKKIKGIDDLSIICAIKISGFDSAFRAGPQAYKPIEEIEPNINTINNVRLMVLRSINFFDKYGPVIKFGFTFDGGYTSVIGFGDGDFMTSDTLWDFKVSKNEPTNKHTLQLLIYYIMGLHSKYHEYKNVKYIGIFNPRNNKVYKYLISKLDNETIKRIEEEIIGY